jgi:hypothetical protein
MLSLALLAFVTAGPGADGVPLVRDGNPLAVIVLPADPSPVARLAAEELAYHVGKASGAKLEIRHEPLTGGASSPAVYVGATQAARAAGIDPGALTREAATLRTVGKDLYIVGNDGPGDALSESNTHAGTLWGVYEVLERELGVRWLWPGELGEDIPRAKDIRLPATDRTFRPAFNQRHLRPGLGPRGFVQAHESLGFSPEHRARYAKDQNLFLRRHRMGRSEDSYYAQQSFGHGHSFEGWWERYGKTHPEWFQLLPDGRRGPADPARPYKVTMCVSNPEFQAEIVRRWREDRAKHPGEPFNIGVGENDDSAQCTCDACRAWDGPPPDVRSLPPGLERSFKPMQASNRYARFAEAVRERAAAVDPDVRVHYYAYLNYFWAPDPAIKLHRNILIGFVPWFRAAGWFPRTEAEQDWIKTQWVGWQRSGVTMFYRPNWFLDGYAMPLVYMHQFADAFQFYARHGMTGTDFDSLQGQWAAQGPNLYLLARLHVRPEAPVDDLLAEYYRAFGPAADTVKAYWDYWESYAVKNSPRAFESIRSRRGGNFRRYALYAQVADGLYPAACFEPAGAILRRALEKTSAGDAATYKQRVLFLRDGLRHAEQCSATAAVVNDPDRPLAEKRAAVARLREVRRGLEHTDVANMDRAAIIETDSWKGVSGLLEP